MGRLLKKDMSLPLDTAPYRKVCMSNDGKDSFIWGNTLPGKTFCPMTVDFDKNVAYLSPLVLPLFPAIEAGA